jgi:hypothetical protein
MIIMMNEPPVGIVAVARIYLCFVLVVVGVFLVKKKKKKSQRKISFSRKKKLTVDPANEKPSPAQVVRPIGKLLVYVVSNDTLALFRKIWRLVDYSPTNQLHPHQHIPHPKNLPFEE